MNLASREYFSQLDTLFHAALRFEQGAARDSFLDEACGGDTSMREQLRELFAGDEAVQQAADPARPLPIFGVYQARELIGRGGMGSVYRATREDGEVSLEVAIKVISAPFWTPALEDRFRRERQILSQLRHPAIATFLDGGVSPDGLPYLVMEYVAGERIDAWCKSRALPLRARLELFIRVCAPVAFAHAHLIVHRDIKPANILVDDRGDPKLLDFGLARTIEDAALHRDHPTLFLTPVYSSPGLLRGEAPSVADDVYSLGVVLYELLSGSRPFGAAGSTPAEIINEVLSSEAAFAPHRPSALADACMSPVPREIDAIALRAVAKSPAERYGSVAELAADIENYLAGRPVHAAAGGAWYRLGKYVARHRVGVTAAVLLVLSMAIGIGATLVQAREAQRQRAIASRRFEQARELIRYMMFELQSSIQNLPGATPIKADMVRHSLDYLDRLAAEKNTSDDSLAIDIAAGYSELADVLGHPLRPNLGQAVQARSLYERAIAISQPVVVRSPSDQRARRVLSRARLMLGMSLVFYRQWDKGRALVETASRDLDRMVAGSPRDFETLKQAAIAKESLAVAIGQKDGFASAASERTGAELRRSIDYSQAALSLHPGDPEVVEQLALTYNRLAILTQTFDRPSAASYFELALGALDRLPQSAQSTPAIRNRRAAILLAQGWNLGSAGDYGLGLAAMTRALGLIDELSAEDPRNRTYTQARASIFRNRGVIEDYAGESQRALADDIQAVQIYQRLLALNPQSPYFRTSVAELQANAALLSAKLGQQDQADGYAAQGVPVLKATATKPDATSAELNLAARFLTSEELSRVCDARLGLEFALRADRSAAGKDYVVLETLAQAYWVSGDREQALTTMERALNRADPAPVKGKTSRVRVAFEKTIAGYRSRPSPTGCRAHGRP